ncbi:ABC transporter substrate-binding protein [Martelella endophytica]|uniref:Peptide ABC transporter substrate-binding protein n=1 Tax=Martelella endophytica TaxID=1486262 RepID=A0A0D5LNB5_MAREN|nr:ABC transporter substrate-binding protein [Martelella endophytica]AJY45719.1 peptide ABC transporter substrate-binding protein [Martelella endophytica]
MKLFLRSGSLAVALLASVSLAHAFQEAPMLKAEVDAGKLPPVDERLPADPMVVDAVEVGQYGGTWHRAYSGPGDRWGPTKLMEERVLKYVPDAEGNISLVPAYIESYSVNDDSTEFTFTLLDGMKWSDGEPVTTEDVEFWYNDVFLNKALTPTIDPTFSPGGVPMTLEVKDDRTFTIKFAQPYVYFLNILAKDSTGEPSLDRPSFLYPKHYLSQFNDHYANADELAKAAADHGVQRWSDLWGSKGPITSWWQNPELPVITAWKIETPAPANVVTMVRNPYYWAVDQDGNQLPYIDRIEHRLFDAADSFNLMIVQGQIDMQMRYVNTSDFTFYKENADKGGYHVGTSISANVWSFVPNLNTTDEQLNPLFNNADFRHALSVGIDRETINELGFAGLGEPRSVSPVSGSPYFNADWETHWTEYDPDLANELLDKVGLSERDADDYRLLPNGKRLQIVVEAYQDYAAPILEVAADYYKDIGIELLPRIIDRTQWDDNRDNNNFQIQYTPVDRLSVVSADPRNIMGNDSYAQQHYVWYSTEGESGIEPPADDPIRTIWSDWDKASVAGSVEDADAALNDMIGTFVDQGYVIGLVGEEKAPMIVKNDFMNVRNDLIQDDVTRGVGYAQPQQFWIKQGN